MQAKDSKRHLLKLVQKSIKKAILWNLCKQNIQKDSLKSVEALIKNNFFEDYATKRFKKKSFEKCASKRFKTKSFETCVSKYSERNPLKIVPAKDLERNPSKPVQASVEKEIAWKLGKQKIKPV